MYGSLTFLPPSNFAVFDGRYSLQYCKELKISQIAQLNQLFQLLHLAHVYGHGFYEVSVMLMRKNVNNDISKDLPIYFICIFISSSFVNINNYYLPYLFNCPGHLIFGPWRWLPIILIFHIVERLLHNETRTKWKDVPKLRLSDNEFTDHMLVKK